MYLRTAAAPADPAAAAQAIPAAAAHPVLAPHERARLRAAVARAKQLYPPVVARLIERELMTWEEFGHRLDMHGEVAQLVHHISTAVIAPAPTPQPRAEAG